MRFEWDDDNLRHVREESPRGVSPRLVREVADNEPVLVDNPEGQGRSGSHKMIGPNDRGQFWTIVLLDRYDDLWRPITGWQSSLTEVQIWKDAE